MDFDKILGLQDLYQRTLHPDIFNKYLNVIFQGAIAGFHKTIIDSYLTKHNDDAQHGLMWAINYKNLDSFKYVYDEYANGQFNYVDILANSFDDFVVDAIKHLALCPKLDPNIKKRILIKMCSPSPSSASSFA
jgi:hypothetical protein